jgi:hypothetical protein
MNAFIPLEDLFLVVDAKAPSLTMVVIIPFSAEVWSVGNWSIHQPRIVTGTTITLTSEKTSEQGNFMSLQI